MRMRSRIYGDLGKSLLILIIRHFVSSARIDLLAQKSLRNFTPDLVCKLSVHEMEMLGVTSGGDMMSL